MLRQLVAFVGQDTFFTGLRAYLAKHAFGNTDLTDLLVELEAASGLDLHEWARTWLETSGVATLRPRWDGDDLVVVQDSEVLRDHVIEVGLYDDQDGAIRLRERFEVKVTGAETPVPGATPADLLLLNDRDLTFAKIRFDDRSLMTVLARLGVVEDPLARALCWGALWDAVRDGELPARDHVAAVLASVGAEHDPALVETLLLQAHRAATQFAPPGEQGRLLAAVASACWNADVAAGSDLQLVRVRAAIRATTEGRRLHDLLTGTAVPAGLVVDNELRWHVVRRAAALGELDEDAVRRELAADRTASGQLQADTALAALPSAASKQRVWESLVDGAATNAEVRAKGTGFWQHGQDALLLPYVDRYLQDVPRMWEELSPQLAGSLALQLFPSTLIRADVVERVGALLGRDDLPAGLRRVLLETHDDLRRALHAQASAPAG